ncbi:hypothetical protein JCM11641_004885 [Rhodosporidiobolus odoratus]
MSAFTSSSLARDTLESLGELAASTWPEWKVYLPKALAAVTCKPAASFYLNAEFEKWVSLADSLKLLVVNYGGADAKARVQGFETELGDAKGLWDQLGQWYGNTGTGIEKVAIVSKFWHERWDETESPALWFARLLFLADRLNVLYKADTALAANKTDPSVIAASHASVNNFPLRDIIISFLPASYAESLTPIWTNKSTLEEVKTAVQNLSATRTSREEIAGEEARRVSGMNGPGQAKGKPDGGYQGRQKKGEKGLWPPRLSANRYTNRQKWRGGTCSSCFRDGHCRANCKVRNDKSASARLRTAKLKKNGSLVPLEDANALLVADLVDPDHLTLTALVARLDLTPRQNLLPPSIPPASPASPAPQHASLTVIDNEVQTAPRTFCVTEEHDKNALLPSSAPDLFSALPSSHVSLPSKYILDSGATCHFTTRHDHLHDYKAYTLPRKINGAFGSGGAALGKGILKFAFSSGPFHIAHIMLVPGLGVNLLSMTRLMMAGMRFKNDRATLTLLDNNR